MASYPPTFVLRPVVMTYYPGVVYRSCADGRAGRDGSNPAASIPKSENMGSLSRFPSVHLACTIRYIVHSHRGKSLVSPHLTGIFFGNPLSERTIARHLWRPGREFRISTMRSAKASTLERT